MNRKTKMRKLYLDNIQDFKERISQDQYGFFVKHHDKKDNLKMRIYQINVFDRLDNHDMNLLMRKIHGIKNNRKYQIKTYFRKPGTKELDYISRNLEGSAMFSIADITFNDDKWINSITVSGTYVTNSEIIIKYAFCFKKSISTSIIIHEYVMDHQKDFGKYMYHCFYTNLKNSDSTYILAQEESCFYDSLQDYIVNLLYTKYGHKYALPMEIDARIVGYNKKKGKKIANSFLTKVYRKEKTYVLFDEYIGDRFYVTNCYYGKKWNEYSMFQSFSYYSVEMYYRAFRNIEMTELEEKMRKYLNSRKKSVSTKDMKWMINRLRGIEEKEKTLRNIIKEDFEKQKWERYTKKRWVKENIISDNTTSSRFKELYSNNLHYLQAISETRNNKVLYNVAIISLVIALLGLIISFLTNFISKENHNTLDNTPMCYVDVKEEVKI